MGSGLVQGESDDSRVSIILIDRGWRQGTIFRAPGVRPSSIQQDGDVLISMPRESTCDGRFVVASQSCDINAPLSKEPVVEALACSVEPNEAVRASYSKSFRKFEIDTREGLVAHAVDRVAFDKRALLSLTPGAWPGTSERLQDFARWLGRRSSRAAIPTPIVTAFVDPLRVVLRELRKRQRDSYIAFNRGVKEIRLGLPESESPPFDIPLLLLLEGESLTHEAATAIGLVESMLRAKLDSNEARLSEVVPWAPSSLSVQTYFGTALVELEHLTYDGEESTGADPFSES
jgi:hypothetical protein